MIEGEFQGQLEKNKIEEGRFWRLERGWMERKEESRGQLGRFEGKLKRDSDHVT